MGDGPISRDCGLEWVVREDSVDGVAMATCWRRLPANRRDIRVENRSTRVFGYGKVIIVVFSSLLSPSRLLIDIYLVLSYYPEETGLHGLAFWDGP